MHSPTHNFMNKISGAKRKSFTGGINSVVVFFTENSGNESWKGVWNKSKNRSGLAWYTEQCLYDRSE